MPKKTSRRGTLYTAINKRYLVTNIRLVKPISKGGWERVHFMHHTMYSNKNQTVESLRKCFANLHHTKVPSGDPSMPIEVREAKMAWVQICAKLKWSTGSSDEENGGDYEEWKEVDEDDDNLQEL
eukprot:15338600-Ditylum_brightwellii.AAC.1